MMSIATPDSLNLSKVQRFVLRRAITPVRSGNLITSMERRYPRVRRSIDIMKERNLVVVVNEQEVHPTDKGRQAFDRYTLNITRFAHVRTYVKSRRPVDTWRGK